jgi:hypothetical protein
MANMQRQGFCQVVNETGPNKGYLCSNTVGDPTKVKCAFHLKVCIDVTIDTCDDNDEESDGDYDSDMDGFINDEPEEEESDDESEEEEETDDDEEDDDDLLDSDDDEEDEVKPTLSRLRKTTDKGNEAKERELLVQSICRNMPNYLARLSLEDMKKFKEQLNSM